MFITTKGMKKASYIFSQSFPNLDWAYDDTAELRFLSGGLESDLHKHDLFFSYFLKMREGFEFGVRLYGGTSASKKTNVNQFTLEVTGVQTWECLHSFRVVICTWHHISVYLLRMSDITQNIRHFYTYNMSPPKWLFSASWKARIESKSICHHTYFEFR